MFEGSRLTVSVVTPSWNQGRFLGRTLGSVAQQSWPVLEHLVIDGGSTDETLDVLRAAPAGLRWVSEPDRGQAHAVNKGIAASSGDIIAWINSDDVYYPGALETAARFLAQNPQVDVVYGDADHIDAAGAVTEDYPTRDFDLAALYHGCFICQPAAFFRRRVVGAYGPLDERLHYCMDYEFWLRLARAGARFAHIPVKLAGSRLHADAKTLRYREPVFREINDMFGRMLGRVPDEWLWNYANIAVGRRIDAARQPRRYAAALAARALGAAWRWNRRVSPDMLGVVGGGARRRLRRWAGRAST